MTNSYVQYLERVTEGIIDDVVCTFPHLRNEMKKDLSRLRKSAQQRGLGVFTLDLPALLKHLDRCLVEGVYTKSNLALSRARPASNTIPDLFRGLYLHIFEPSGAIRDNADVNAIAFLRQLLATGKKVDLNAKKERAYEAISDFFSVEASLPIPVYDWTAEDFLPGCSPEFTTHGYAPGRRVSTTSIRNDYRNGECSLANQEYDHLEVVQQVFNYVVATLGVFDAQEWRPKHGPGAVSDRRSTSYKYEVGHWPDRLNQCFPMAQFAYANYDHWLSDLPRLRDDVGCDLPSRLIIVPKTQKTPRLIAAEPTGHQWCQQALRDYFSKRVSETWLSRMIRFNDQTRNQALALSASRTGSHWTVDLSAASDRLTCRLVEAFSNGNESLLRALQSSRTAWLYQDIDRNMPQCIELRKFSTMGSAVTFPLQTLIFSSLAVAACILSKQQPFSQRRARSYAKRISVFGDDIVIPSYAGEVLERLLGHFDFKVNDDKTCRKGKFRESCGVEAYDGCNVTPSYTRKLPDLEKPESIISGITTVNNFYTRGYWHASAAMRDSFPLKGVPYITMESGMLGWKTMTYTRDSIESRWNQELHRYDVRGLKLKVELETITQHNSAQLLQFFTEAGFERVTLPDGEISLLEYHALKHTKIGIAKELGPTGRPSVKIRRGWVSSTDAEFRISG